MIAMLLYFALLIDLAVLSTKVSAYVLVRIRMVSEVSLFLLALFDVLLALASGVSAIKPDPKDFAGIPKGILVLLDISPHPKMMQVRGRKRGRNGMQLFITRLTW